MLGHVHAGQQNISELSNSLAISAPTVTRYLDVLEGSFLITRLQPWFVNIGKRLTKSPKIYIRDSGLLHYLLHVQSFDQLQSNPRIGASWEGYAIEEIRRAMAGRGQLFYYRTQGGAEVDLMIKTPRRPYAMCGNQIRCKTDAFQRILSKYGGFKARCTV